MEYSNISKDWMFNLGGAETLSEKKEHMNTESKSVSSCYSEEESQEWEGSQVEQEYGVSKERNQQVMIEWLKYISEHLEKHDRRAATADQVATHDKVIQTRLAENRMLIEKTVRELHAELRKSSLRQRLTVYAFSSVLISTLLLVANLFQKNIVIRPHATALILMASILFWFMARCIPGLQKLPEIHIDD